jgi:hypothetical protein
MSLTAQANPDIAIFADEFQRSEIPASSGGAKVLHERRGRLHAIPERLRTLWRQVPSPA